MYKDLQGTKEKVIWRNLFFGNLARPRANFILWLARRRRFMTKDRLDKIGMVADGACNFCNQMENCNHLFFECCYASTVWTLDLNWLRIKHVPLNWNDELIWICKQLNGKSCRSKILKMAVAETIYAVWTTRNKIIFQGLQCKDIDSKEIIDAVRRKCDQNEKLIMSCDRLYD